MHAQAEPHELMIEKVLKYKFFTFATVMTIVSLCIWYYILSIASYTFYPPLSVLMQSGSVPDGVVGLHYFTGALSILFLGWSAFKREVSIWVVGLFIFIVICTYFKMSFSFTRI